MFDRQKGSMSDDLTHEQLVDMAKILFNKAVDAHAAGDTRNCIKWLRARYVYWSGCMPDCNACSLLKLVFLIAAKCCVGQHYID